MTRRTLLAATPGWAGALAAPAASEKLAINGGDPVRSTPLTGASYPGAQLYDQQEQQELLEALESRSLYRWYGPQTPKKASAFEQELAQFMGVRYALAATSGTASLHLALTALGVGPGDEVILPAWAWHSCYTSIVLTGALPVFAECDESFHIDPDDVARKITPHTKAIMVVHLFGAAADLDPLLGLARKHGLKVLEDAAQSVGAQYKGKRLGSIGDVGIYSFQLNKMITAGEGGALVTNDPLLFERATRFHDLGLLRPGHQALLGKTSLPGFVGTNYRMNEMTAAVMRAQLRKLEAQVNRIRRHFSFVREQLRDLPGLRTRPSADPDGDIGIAFLLLLANKPLRDKFVAALRAENVPGSAPSGSMPLPPLPYIEQKMVPHPAWPTFHTARGKAIRYGASCCPRTMELYHRGAGIAIGPRYTESDLKDIVAAVRKVHRALVA